MSLAGIFLVVSGWVGSGLMLPCQPRHRAPPGNSIHNPNRICNAHRVLEQWDFSASGDAPHKKTLHPFEVAAIANLMTTSSDRDEACTCPPF